MRREALTRVTRRFFSASYLIALALCCPFAKAPVETALAAHLFAWIVLLSYAGLYLVPAYLLTRLVTLGCTQGAARAGAGRVCRLAVWTTALLGTSLTAFLLFVDRSVHEVLGFHLNGLVCALLRTPDGIGSLGAADGTEVRALLAALGLLALHGLVLYACIHSKHRRPDAGSRRTWRKLVLLWALLLAAQAVGYATSQLYGYPPVLVCAARFPAYQRLTFGRLAQRCGLGPERPAGFAGAGPPLALRYPPRLPVDEQGARPNMVWLVIESLRADALTPEVMPHTSALAARSLSCARHYSGGNNTRMGIFSLFYGLYGSYWFSFLDERCPPLLLDALQRRGYRIEAWSSASLSSPELDKTVFSGLRKEQLHALRRGLSKPESDRALVRDLEAALEDRDSREPFAAFLFFDSTHAPYHFAPESAIRESYAQDIDFARLDAGNVGAVRNRYLDAVHDVDGRVGEVVELLARLGLERNTLVLVTGDHGQELLEHGNWAHNSSFCDEQLLVPFVLHVPEREPQRLERMTSHLDVAPTILRLLGYDLDPEGYSLGFDLLGTRERGYTVAADWTEICRIDDRHRITLPFRGYDLFGAEVRSSTGELLADLRGILTSSRGELTELLHDMARFGKAGSLQP